MDLGVRENARFRDRSKDADFHQRSSLHGAPPKVVWIRLCNCNVDQTLRALLDAKPDIDALVADEFAAFLAVRSRLAAVPCGHSA